MLDAVRNVGRRARAEARGAGALPVARRSAAWAAHYAAGRVRVACPPAATVTLLGERYELLHHPYNRTWTNERAVEVPIGRRAVDRAAAGRVLEVGNVLSHYAPVEHEIVDKYERAPGVRNADVMELEPDGSYDLVLSLSTLEHAGFDEQPRDAGKGARALERLPGLLAPGGRLLFTVPLGYNPVLDATLAARQPDFTQSACLRRDGRYGAWREVPCQTAWDAPYDRIFYAAEAVFVGVVDAP